MRAMLGQTTSDALAVQVLEQHNVFLDQALAKVLTDCRWASVKKRITVDVGAEATLFNYPTDCNAGGILEMAVWDTNELRYIPMESRVIPVRADQDQEQATGGDTFTAVKGRPQFFEQRLQVQIWPYTDQAYKLRLSYTIIKQFLADTQTTPCDALLVIYFAAFLVANAQGDQAASQAETFSNMYRDRMQDLRAWQNTGEKVAIDNSAAFDEDEMFEDRLPQWDRSPTIRP